MIIRYFLQTRFSKTLFNKTLVRVLALTRTAEHSNTFQTLGRAFEALRENKKLGREFEKLGRVFVLQHGLCCPNQPRYFTVNGRDGICDKAFSICML